MATRAALAATNPPMSAGIKSEWQGSRRSHRSIVSRNPPTPLRPSGMTPIGNRRSRAAGLAGRHAVAAREHG